MEGDNHSPAADRDGIDTDETSVVFSDCRIGQDDRQWQLFDVNDNREAALSLISQARRRIRILSRYLEPQLLNNNETAQAIRRGVVGNRRFSAQIAVHEPRQLARLGHRMLMMGQQLSDYVSFRRISPAHETMENMIILVDDTAFLHRIHSENWIGVVNFNDPGKTRRLNNIFDLVWNAAAEDSELRQQHI